MSPEYSHTDEQGRVWYKARVEVWPCGKCGMKNPYPPTGGAFSESFWGCSDAECPNKRKARDGGTTGTEDGNG